MVVGLMRLERRTRSGKQDKVLIERNASSKGELRTRIQKSTGDRDQPTEVKGGIASVLGVAELTLEGECCNIRTYSLSPLASPICI